MMDFVRLNLNAFIGGIAFLIVLIVFRQIVIRMVGSEYRKYVGYVFNGILAIFLFGAIFVLISQMSVNNLPKAEVDRSFTVQSQNNYQNRVLENAKKGSE